MEQSLISQTDFATLLHLQKKTAIEWRSSTYKERLERLKILSDWIKKNQKKIQQALWDDFRKPPIETDLSEIFPVTSEINHVAKNLKSWMSPSKVSTPLPMLGTSSYLQKEPKGTSLIISPWNYPFNLAIGPLVSALAAGCPVVIKPSEWTPHTSQLIEDMVGSLYKPEEVKVFQGDASVSQELLNLPFDHIFFTGSPQIGKIIMEKAAQHLSSVTLELGGKSPAIVTTSANLADTARKIVFGKFVNSGQTCIAPDYILVHQDSKDQLVAELTLAIKEMYDPKLKGIEQSPDLARLISDRHFQRLNEWLQDALVKGAKLEFGGKADPKERYIEPTLLSGISEEMQVAQEEIFGPILPILTYQILEQAIEYVNAKPKPLALYIFDQSKEAKEILHKTSSGNAVINDCVLHFLNNELPFGGVNNSGLGKAHGYYGFLAFSNEKGVMKQRIGLTNVSMLRPPYGIKAKKVVQSLIKWF
ncbi:aldehyde dehydrogenase (NAD+) [Algoriphagus boseongensis]|uniref:Aldehyde dehydrogenase n=1 Tax=Algoriphagus boseongensis TaxID=1442587 RepID=A0A4R6T0M3_9BACT|nr:aldehyde dehydrogenase family protein [Algoriphagus boseongensis]TDQ12965.1 aldehyde dehydrogenase (NAD+) [Algoriphagus boseongensis]